MNRGATFVASLLAPLAIQAAPGDLDVGARIAESAAAAEKLQGPLDGTWSLCDRRGRAIYELQIVDPASGGGLLQVGWMRPGPNGAVGVVDRAWRSRGRLALGFRAPGGRVSIKLTHRHGRVWRGVLISDGEREPVTLRPGPGRMTPAASRQGAAGAS